MLGRRCQLFVAAELRHGSGHVACEGVYGEMKEVKNDAKKRRSEKGCWQIQKSLEIVLPHSNSGTHTNTQAVHLSSSSFSTHLARTPSRSQHGPWHCATPKSRSELLLPTWPIVWFLSKENHNKAAKGETYAHNHATTKKEAECNLLHFSTCYSIAHLVPRHSFRFFGRQLPLLLHFRVFARVHRRKHRRLRGGPPQMRCFILAAVFALRQPGRAARVLALGGFLGRGCLCRRRAGRLKGAGKGRSKGNSEMSVRCSMV